jgi:hypothetical protein
MALWSVCQDLKLDLVRFSKTGDRGADGGFCRSPSTVESKRLEQSCFAASGRGRRLAGGDLAGQ